MNIARVTSRGRITIPKDIRQALGIGRGDLLRFELVGNGVVVFQARLDDDGYVDSVGGTLDEWLSSADDEAFRHL